MKEIDLELKLKILKMHIDGLTNREIAKRVNVSHPTIAKIIGEVKSGKSDILPWDVAANLRQMTEVAKVMKRFGISDEELENVFLLGLTLREMQIDRIDLMKLGEIYKEHPEEFPSIVKAAKWVVDKEKETGTGIDEIIESVESLTRKKNQIKAEYEELLEDKGRIEKTLEELMKQKSDLEKEVSLANRIKGITGENYDDVNEFIELVCSLGMEKNEIKRILKTLSLAVQSRLPPETINRRGEELDFLMKYGVTEENLKNIASNMHITLSLEEFIGSFLSFSANRESMMKEAIKEMEELRRYSTESLEQDLKERKEIKVKLDDEIDELEEIKNELESDISILRKRREALSMENASNTMKWNFILKFVQGQSTYNDFIGTLLPDYLKNLNPIVQLPEPKKEVYILSHDSDESEGKGITKIIG
ncbi:MAG: helix-turn-helix domain-containing protein, partial [Candidatus Parvarchaeota archaeon]